MEKVNEQQDMSEKMMERAAFEAWLEVEIGNRFAPEFDLRRNEEGGYRYQPAAAYWKAWQARASLPVGVPDGWKLVPVEPTLEMVAAIGFNGDIELAIGHGAIVGEVIEQYRAMLAADPSANQPAPERVNVPVELAVRLAAPLPDDRGWQSWHTQDMIEASKELRVLLASHAKSRKENP